VNRRQRPASRSALGLVCPRWLTLTSRRLRPWRVGFAVGGAVDRPGSPGAGVEAAAGRQV